jgi:1-acyl-sn-glycerol-3-phosphate acyltransferase
MRAARALWRIARVLPHLVHGLWIVARRFPHLEPAHKHALVQWWSRGALERLGVTLAITQPAASTAGGQLVVANHVSWLDIAAIHAVLPQARFVSKADVKHWPVVGAMVAGAGTLFIERANKRDALRVVHQTAAALKHGDSVAVFPEGTTGAGPELLPFHANLLQAAVAVEAPVLPVLLRWVEPGQAFSTAAQFIGDTTLVQSLWRVACAEGLTVRVAVLPAVEPGGRDRRELADTVRRALVEAQARDLA